jgi:hypothetical protein
MFHIPLWHEHVEDADNLEKSVHLLQKFEKGGRGVRRITYRKYAWNDNLQSEQYYQGNDFFDTSSTVEEPLQQLISMLNQDCMWFVLAISLRYWSSSG